MGAFKKGKLDKSHYVLVEQPLSIIKQTLPQPQISPVSIPDEYNTCRQTVKHPKIYNVLKCKQIQTVSPQPSNSCSKKNHFQKCLSGFYPQFKKSYP
jgi:hypothetical protein